MVGTTHTRFRELQAEKQSREGREVATYRAISAATGISPTTLTKWANNRVQDYDQDVIARLCDFFDCNVGDLIVYERDKDEDSSKL